MNDALNKLIESLSSDKIPELNDDDYLIKLLDIYNAMSY